ncbi:MAG: 16S rRNA (guanine(527)-N(7))-methyltransferase RsmG [Candidatus Cloacimonetes bacterium]|nr:16S rRNA (guanine(527)-N(7))-methyltransferase RsmG [Candidatus Cloacimonadota bacterium]
MFIEYLKNAFSDPQEQIIKFDLFHDLLLEANKRVNLISRQTKPEQLWSYHFYDSLLPLSCDVDFNSKMVMDLGSGGGLPGIPLAISNPSTLFILMDSREKKILELKQMIKKLDLNNCYPICKRLEEFRWSEVENLIPENDGLDVIVCRSVKITPKLLRKMRVLLKDAGYILLYKGREIEESWLLKDAEILLKEEKPWGERTLLKINKI